MTRQFQKNQLLKKNFQEKKRKKASFFIMKFRSLLFGGDVSKNIKKNSVIQMSHQQDDKVAKSTLHHAE